MWSWSIRHFSVKLRLICKFAPSVCVSWLILWNCNLEKSQSHFFHRNGNSAMRNESYTKGADKAVLRNAAIYKAICIPVRLKAAYNRDGLLSWSCLESGMCLSSESSVVHPGLTVIVRIFSR